LKSQKDIILLETEAQVRDCLSWLDVNSRTQIIAVTPFAMYELDRQGVDYRIPEDYYNPQELYQMGIDNFRKVEDLSNMIDSAIRQADSEVAEHNLKPAMFSFLDFKILYDSVSVLIFQLSNIINKEKPEVIYVYDTDIYNIDANKSSPYLFFDNRESIWALLLSLDGWKTSIKKLQHISEGERGVIENNDKNIFHKIKRVAVPWLQTQPKLYSLALAIQKKGLTGLLYWIRNYLGNANGSPILIYGVGYNWDECNVELTAGGIGPVYEISYDFCWKDKSKGLNLENLNDVWLELQKNRKFRDVFISNGIDFFEILKERFEFLVKKITIICIIAVQDTTELIAKRNIKAVVTATFSTPVGHSVAQAAHNSGIPVVTWQHGGYGAMENHPIVNYCDLINSDAHFVFGDGVVESYIKAANIYGTELVSIGSTSLENIKNKKLIKKENVTKKVILYVTSVYIQNNICITTNPPMFDTIFWRTQQAIMDILGKHDDYSVIIKLHPSEMNQEHPLKLYVKDRGFNNFKFIRQEKTFIYLLSAADIVVIDLPCTTILQALAARKPVFAYTGLIYYNEHAMKSLSKSAVCSKELNEFLNKLDKYLTHNIYESDVNNTEFLEMYGITSKEGTAGGRASKELKRIIDNFQTKLKGNIK